MNETNVQKFLRSEISFYITLAVAVGTIAGFYFGLSNQINLIAERLDTHINSTSYMSAKIASLSEEVAVLKNQK